jgi:hypothetical protein
MRPASAVLAIGLSLAAIIAGCAVAWGAGPTRTGYVERVLLPAGSVFEMSQSNRMYFTTSGDGVVLVGSLVIVGWSWPGVGPARGAYSTGVCPVVPANTTTVPTRNYTINETMDPGTWIWGTVCWAGPTTVTVTQSLEVVYP